MNLRILEAIERIIKENLVIPVVMEPPKVIHERYPKIKQEELNCIGLNQKEINNNQYSILVFGSGCRIIE